MKRLRRWILPASTLSTLGLAVAGIGWLALGEVSPEPTAGWTPTHTGWADEPGEVSLEAPPTQPRAQAHPTQAPAQAPRAPRQPAPARGPDQARETRQVLRASPWLVQLAKAEDLNARTRLVDDMVARLPAEQAVEVLTGLVDAILPGEFWEAEALRLYVMGRLGEQSGPEAEAALVARLAPERPRPQRLLATELLALRPGARVELASIAAGDHDQVVRERARRALERVE